jgi:DNA-binding Xre family transcriptional regulator
MIKNELEYKKAVKKLQEEEIRIVEMKERLAAKGLKEDEIKRAVDPVESFHFQFKEEVESYERLLRGEFDELINLRGLGHLLISLRIAKRITQKDLANTLAVSDSQVSRDERNEYHGITLDRAEKILEALGVKLFSKIEIQPFQKKSA